MKEKLFKIVYQESDEVRVFDIRATSVVKAKQSVQEKLSDEGIDVALSKLKLYKASKKK